ncbi:LuxR C-terminal-related transcriptional regulator [Frankia sp. AiPa1]|uniref:LuxR C-terminal-related transcriptional regulator n=1 Tax=Frankia sp. AiPa1 TaxID=573492 RepID=UPI00202AC80C|nr:LuxR C-terminal-related transcriptional regulator [Frankia sp. AiPa1]MCL9760601.1 LuxR C-terminal-related transcriptional regulator [Frankia sp. AiPa1]
MTVDVSAPSRVQTVLPRALARLRASSGAHLTFGGIVAPHSGRLTVTNVDGPAPSGLLGASVPPGTGIGGQVVRHSRPVVINDSAATRRVLRSTAVPFEGSEFGAILAVPVSMGGTVVAVLYGAMRTEVPFTEAAVRAAIATARLMERELGAVAVHGDSLSSTAPPGRRPPIAAHPVGAVPLPRSPGQPQESLRLAYRELQEVTEHVADPLLRGRIGGVSELLRGLLDQDTKVGGRLALTPRELEVLAQVALGLSNVETARRLTVSPETVKAYLRSIMRKLGVRNRTAAVHAARQLGMLP